jgi:hypothetical protein
MFNALAGAGPVLQRLVPAIERHPPDDELAPVVANRHAAHLARIAPPELALLSTMACSEG